MILLKATETLISYTRNTVNVDASRQIENNLQNTITNNVKIYIKKQTKWAFTDESICNLRGKLSSMYIITHVQCAFSFPLHTLSNLVARISRNQNTVYPRQRLMSRFSKILSGSYLHFSPFAGERCLALARTTITNSRRTHPRTC